MSSITALDANGKPIKKGSGVKPAKYQARYRTPDGASRKRVFDGKREAETFLTSVDHKKLTGEYVDRIAGRVLFGEYARRWADAQPHRPSTAASLTSILRTHVLPALGDKPMRSIMTSDIQAFVSGLPLAPSTVRNIYAKVSAIFAAAVLDRLIASSPCTRAVKLPRLSGDEVTPMRAAEVRGIIESTDEQYGALLILMAGTGLRPAEALGLTVDRIDFLRRTIKVDRQLLTATGGQPTFAPPKTPSSNRTVVAPASVLDALASHLERFGSGPDGLLFTRDGEPMRRDYLGKLWRAAAVEAKVSGRSPHDLRHYAASVMIESGASVKAVQRQLGHEKATTTLDTYAHLWPESEDVARRALESGLASVVSVSCPGDSASG